MTEVSSVQWFPGHMAKTRRIIKQCLPLVDAVVEITDARIPQSSRNPELDRLIGNKPRIVVLNKCDNADDFVTAKWIEYYKSKGIAAFAADCKTGKGLKNFLPLVKEVLRDLLERRKAKNMSGMAIRLMVVGIPNVGKSSFINRMANAKKTKVEDRPGVTRDKQWVKIDSEVELLDMPGVLWPKFEDKIVGERLAFTGAVKDEIVDLEALASRLLEFMKENYKNNIIERYGIELADEDAGFDILQKVARKRGMLLSGGETNTERASIAVLDEFRGGKLGKITLESPPERN
ncbi:MAG TPA: ribosome biogenesis GTPase YlqF [Oscillospiraceae bacterium]|nr:ribosome biogenesis GTPase YlqF [Oscillospiraceae bacterium]